MYSKKVLFFAMLKWKSTTLQVLIFSYRIRDREIEREIEKIREYKVPVYVRV